jgi:hypothetical protein
LYDVMVLSFIITFGMWTAHAPTPGREHCKDKGTKI